mgnify:CR=1 FL=1
MVPAGEEGSKVRTLAIADANMALVAMFSKAPSAVLGSFVASAILGRVSSATAAGQRYANAAALPFVLVRRHFPFFGNVLVCVCVCVCVCKHVLCILAIPVLEIPTSYVSAPI